MTQLIMENIITLLLQAIIPSILAAVAWKQRETSKQNEARRVREKAEMEARNAREKAALEQQLLESQREAQTRFEQVESQQIRIQSEADSLRATHDHHSELIKHLGRTEEARQQETQRWRELMDSYRNSFSEASKLQATAHEHVAQAITNSNSLIEIQTAAYGTLKTTVENSLQTIGAKIDTSNTELHLIKAAVELLTKRINVMIEGQDTTVEANTERHNSLKHDTQSTVTELGAIKTIAEAIAKSTNAILKRMEQTQPIPVEALMDENHNADKAEPETDAIGM